MKFSKVHSKLQTWTKYNVHLIKNCTLIVNCSVFLPLLLYLERDKPKDSHKKHYFYFCQQLVIKLPWHLERNHKYEDDVKALKYRKSLERRQICTKIAQKGDYQATVKSLKGGKDFICMVQENGQGNSSGTLPCKFCLCFFSSESRILAHEKKYFMKNNSVKLSTIGSRMMKWSEITNGEYTILFIVVYIKNEARQNIWNYKKGQFFAHIRFSRNADKREW